MSTTSSAWCGIHLLPKNDAELTALIGELPALAELGVNLLITEVNYHFAYRSHPELQEPGAISPEMARQLLAACRAQGIRLIPHFQCVGHQSWAETTFPLLRKYPELDETPGQFPHNEGIYCRSWCPQQPQINAIIFELFDELIETFEADALHVGLDEIFLFASEHCPRCKDADPAVLLAQIIQDYHKHLVGKRGVEMLMWGDRLLSDAETGYGEWEAARNGTDPAIDHIPTDIIICDWHYEPRENYPSLPIFLEKGFRVLPSGWRDETAVGNLIADAQKYTSPAMLGYLCTTWGSVPPGEMAQWPPLLTATNLMRASGK